MLIPQIFLKRPDLACLKLGVDELDIDQLKNVPNGINILKSRLDKLDADKLVLLPVDLSKLSDVEKITLLKRLNVMNTLKKANVWLSYYCCS